MAATQLQRIHTPESYAVDFQPTCIGEQGHGCALSISARSSFSASFILSWASTTMETPQTARKSLESEQIIRNTEYEQFAVFRQFLAYLTVFRAKHRRMLGTQEGRRPRRGRGRGFFKCGNYERKEIWRWSSSLVSTNFRDAY